MYIIGIFIYLTVIASLIFILFYGSKKMNWKRSRVKTVKPPTFKQRLIFGLTIIQFMIVMLALFGIGSLFINYIQRYLIVPKDALLYIKTNEMYIAKIAWFLIAIPITGVIMMFFHHKDYDYVAKYKGGTPIGTVAESFVPIMVLLILMFTLAFPFCVLGIGNYLYFSENHIGASTFWNLSQQEYRYSEVKEVKVEYKKLRENKYRFDYVITFPDGNSIDIFFEKPEKILAADEILRAKMVLVNRDKISQTDFQEITNANTKRYVELLESIFIIE